MSEGEHLRPHYSPLFSDFRHDYDRLLNELLFTRIGIGAQWKVSALCMPSFDAEWSIEVRGTRFDGVLVILHAAHSNIWLSRSAPPEVRRSIVSISEATAEVIRSAWLKMLLGARHDADAEIALDGVTYYFDADSMSAQTWSPRPDSAPGRLVTLAELLRRYAEEGGSDELAEQIRDAAERMC